MKTRSFVLIGLGLLPLFALGLALGAARLSRRPAAVGLVDGHLRPCPDTPNCVRSESGSGAADIQPLSFVCEPELAFRSLLDFVAAEENAQLLDTNDRYAHVVYTTSLLGFADDVEFRLDQQARVVHVRSASRIGHSDLGANRARVEDIRRRWTPPETEPR